jgi:arginine N-succinyltransferase
MVVVRPVSMSDLDALVELASLAGVGLTTLPKDRDLLTKRIGMSAKAFDRIPNTPGGESYLFVMEDLDTRRVIGACGVVSKVGGFQPFYGYRIDESLFESKQLGISKRVPILTLVEDHDGPAEIGSLFLHPDFRKEGNGKLLQLVRFLFIAEHADAFESTVISEIRGVCDENGNSPFWNAIGQHFFDIDFRRADYLSVVNKKFIADLMPDVPIYISLLPYSAQAVIGQPHTESRQAVKNLEREGLKLTGMVDIFDAGPVLGAPRDEIRTVKESKRMKIGAITDQPIESPVYMIGTTTDDFRATKSVLDLKHPKGLRIPDDTAAALRVKVGDYVRFVELSAPQK